MIETPLINLLNTADKGFDEQLSALLAWKADVSDDVGLVVKQVISDVRTRGDEALLEYTNRFDQRDLSCAAELVVGEAAARHGESDVDVR